MLQHLITRFSPTLIITTLLLATYLAQQHATPLVFLPAGVQLMASVIYGARCLPGCIIGMGLGTALLAHHPVTEANLATYALYATLSTCCLLGLLHLVCRIGGVNNELAGLRYTHIVCIVALQALADTALRMGITGIGADATPALNYLTQASGNLLGSMSVVLTLLALAAISRKRA